MQHITDILIDLNIKWETPINEKKERTFATFICNLLEENDIETIKGLDFIIRDKEVFFKTNYNYFKENGLARITLIGGHYAEYPAFNKERVIVQPVYHLVDIGQKKSTKGNLKITVNFVRIDFI